MKEHHIKIAYRELADADFSEQQKALAERAKAEAERAYAPYSHFSVGCAVLLADGRMLGGNNQENAAFPSGLCAERVAVFSAKAQFPDVPIAAVAIAAKQGGALTENPTPPCGACLQVLVDVENRQRQPMELLLVGRGKSYRFSSVSDCLPIRFCKF